jgi:hypothetical protein
MQSRNHAKSTIKILGEKLYATTFVNKTPRNLGAFCGSMKEGRENIQKEKEKKGSRVRYPAWATY